MCVLHPYSNGKTMFHFRFFFRSSSSSGYTWKQLQFVFEKKNGKRIITNSSNKSDSTTTTTTAREKSFKQAKNEKKSWQIYGTDKHQLFFVLETELNWWWWWWCFIYSMCIPRRYLYNNVNEWKTGNSNVHCLDS